MVMPSYGTMLMHKLSMYLQKEFSFLVNSTIHICAHGVRSRDPGLENIKSCNLPHWKVIITYACFCV